MRISPTSTLLTLVLLTGSVASADEVKGAVTVFPFDYHTAQLDPGTKLAFEEGVRSAAAEYLAPAGYNVITADTQLRLLQDNGVDPTKVCDANCSLSAAREVKAAYFVTGVVSSSEGAYVAFVRLFRAADGRQLYSIELDGKTIREIREAFRAQAPALFAPMLPAAAVATATPAKSSAPRAPSAKSGHELRMPDPAAAPILECDAKLRKAIMDRQMFAYRLSGSTYPQPTPDDMEEFAQKDRAVAADLAAHCAARFGPMYSYPPVAAEGEQLKRSAFVKALNEYYPSRERCRDLQARVDELAELSVAHADDLDRTLHNQFYRAVNAWDLPPDPGCHLNLGKLTR